MGIRSYICIKSQLQNNFWDGISNNKRAHSHLLTLKNIAYEIIHEGIPLDNFESDYMREPYFSWNPPICNTLMAICEGDIDDQYELDENNMTTQLDNDDDSFDEANSQAGGVTNTPVEEVLQVDGDSHNVNITEHIRGNNPCFVATNYNYKGSAGVDPEVPKVVSPMNILILDQFTNNYQIFAQKLVNTEVDLVIRALLLKNNKVIYNYSFNIFNTDNVHNATIAVANEMCNLYLAIAIKGDTLICSLGAGHNGVRVSITRNFHISNLIATLNKIKDKTGLYTIVTALNCDWLEYVGGNTINKNFVIVPNKKTIIPTIDTHLNKLWCSEWSGLKGHSQTKYWFTMPDPFLAAKLMNMSRENLGKCIKKNSGHGW